jgi:hypothetical protein
LEDRPRPRHENGDLLHEIKFDFQERSINGARSEQAVQLGYLLDAHEQNSRSKISASNRKSFIWK